MQPNIYRGSAYGGARMTDTMNIGPLRYAIRRVRKLMDAAREKRLAGYIDFARCEVLVDADLDPQTERITLVHEGWHGWLDHMGYHDVEESLVDAIAFASLALFGDNLELFGPEDDEPYLSKETLARLREGKLMLDQSDRPAEREKRNDPPTDAGQKD
ncbi:unnamed protein product [marine sediment metagenome]|uniref:Uncharacterized protein n=1 Tax=marine sediment metagenome TaxID=412755 RepID=X0V8P8_9ZZZZ